METIELVCRRPDLAGECPIWCAEERSLYWIDARGRSIQRISANGAIDVWKLPARIGSFGFRQAGGLLAAMEDGFHHLDLISNKQGLAFQRKLLLDPQPHLPDNRLNDGKCDRRGRYWCGSRGEDAVTPLGSLYRLTPDLDCRVMDQFFIVPNGIAFSPDDKTIMFADSEGEKLFAFDFDLDAGELSNRRLIHCTADQPYRIDGAAFDTEGGYWCALIGGWAIGRFLPSGTLDRMIRLPVQHPTMCCFGGERLDVMYVTSGTVFLAERELADQPLAGAVFAISHLGAQGIPEPCFAG
jgi:sugar lactone lactonase YvrE